MFEKLKTNLKDVVSTSEDSLQVESIQNYGKFLERKEEALLSRFIFLMPTYMKRVYFHCKMENQKHHFLDLNNCLLSYLNKNNVIFLEQKGHLLDYIEDAYFIAIGFEKIMEELAFYGNKLDFIDAELLSVLDKSRGLVREMIPAQTDAIDDMFQEILSKKEPYYDLSLKSDEAFILLEA